MVVRRYLVTVFLAAAVTAALFLLMQSLIAMGQRAQEKAVRGSVVDFVRARKAEETQEKDRKLPEKMQAEKAPPPPDFDMSQIRPGKTPGASDVTLPRGMTDVNLAGGPILGSAPSDQDVLPLVRIEPRYPRRAQQMGIEGWALLEFTITPLGTVSNVVVVDSEPKGMFDRAAANAVERWKYKPKIVDGKAVPREGVQVVLTFKIEK
jgi:protein TonB